jgi:hypothetical protein
MVTNCTAVLMVARLHIYGLNSLSAKLPEYMSGKGDEIIQGKANIIMQELKKVNIKIL